MTTHRWALAVSLVLAALPATTQAQRRRVSVTHYDVQLEPRLESRTVTGTVTLSMVPTRDGLVFPNWDRPTTDDRALVYQKGGYLLHELRELVGDAAFWAGIKRYTIDHFGASVTSEHLRAAMEQASGKDLRAFFDRWVYP